MISKKIGLVLFSSLILLALSEALSRLFFPNLLGTLYVWDRALGLVPKPNADVHIFSPRLFSFHSKHDANGFRITHRDHQSRSQKILFVGDSMLYGIGVNDEDTFPFQAQAILDSCHKDIEVINSGAPGRGPDYYLKFLELRGADVRASKTVVFFTGNNDWKDAFETKIWKLTRGGQLASAEPLRVESPLFLRSVNVLEKGLDILKGRWAVQRAQTHHLSNPTGEQYDAGLLFLRKIKEKLESLNSELVFVYLPNNLEVDELRRGFDAGPLRAFKQASQEIGFAPYDVTPVLSLSGLSIHKLFISRDSHFTKKANALVASKILRILFGSEDPCLFKTVIK